MQRCYFKGIAESESIEGRTMRMQYDYVYFAKCKNRCDGHNTKCEFYEVREMNDIEEEIAEDSSLQLSETGRGYL